MISDEMKELLSAYVDGELRDADAARVEQLSKRDPELRVEIDAYRKLRRKLREWDEAENAVPLPDSFVEKTLARAGGMVAARRAHRRGRLVRLLVPVAAAAALLLAAGAGLLLARAPSPAAPSPSVADRIAFAMPPLAPAPELVLDNSVLPPAAAGPGGAAVRVDDHFPTRRAMELEVMLRREEAAGGPGKTAIPERRSVTPVSSEVLSLTEGIVAASEPVDSLVALARPLDVLGLPAVGAAGTDEALTLDPAEGVIYRELLGDGEAQVAPLGEVWVAARDESRRTRVVARSDWVARREGQEIPVVWADRIGRPKNAARLDVRDFILGPRARQRLLLAKTGPDDGFLEWLRATYGKGALAEIFEDGARDRERTVNRLVDALARDKDASGFAVLDADGKLMGVELFHDHALMLAFAPRLLRGYLMEAGEDGIRITPPRVAGRPRETVETFLRGLPGRPLHVERELLEGAAGGYAGAPAGLCRATLVGSGGQVAGHGLLVNGTPVHLTLFGTSER